MNTLLRIAMQQYNTIKYVTHLPRSPQCVYLYQIWWGHLVDVINCAEFFIDRLTGVDFVGGGWNLPISIGIEGRR